MKPKNTLKDSNGESILGFDELIKIYKKSLIDKGLDNFCYESNKIEGIFSEQAAKGHRKALDKFLKVKTIKIADLVCFVKTIDPSLDIRSRPGDNVYIGGRAGLAPTLVREALEELLLKINRNEIYPLLAHQDYEIIHPMRDCNGRSGRALWLWQHLRNGTYMKLGFLHQYYYETLKKASDDKNKNRL